VTLGFHRANFGVSQHYIRAIDLDESLTIQIPDSLFECLFAGLKSSSDFLGRTTFIHGQLPILGSERGENTVGERGDALVTLGIQP
jgi:hypothetical protein